VSWNFPPSQFATLTGEMLCDNIYSDLPSTCLIFDHLKFHKSSFMEMF